MEPHAVDASSGGPVVRLVEIDDLLAAPRLSALQLGVLAICFIASVVNGADRQGIGLVAGNMMSALGIGTTQMGWVFALDNLGAVVGAIVCGQLTDRYGRKPVMIVTLALMTLATLFTAHSGSYGTLLAARFVAGLGLGGSVPVFLALASEYVGRPRRGTIAAMIFAGYPLGGALGGAWTGYLLKHHDWSSVFYVGAILPGVILVAAIALLPEALQFLVRTRSGRVRAIAIARRIDPALAGQQIELVNTVETKRGPAGSFRALFSGGLALPTIALWGTYLFLFATTKVAVVWVPSIVTKNGLSPASIALMFGGFNVAALIAQLIPFKLVNWNRVLGVLAFGLLLITASIAVIGVLMGHAALVAIALAVTGYGVGLATSRAIAITATLYPAHQRGIGMGAAMASSRFGQVLAPPAIAWLIASAVGSSAILYVIAALPLVAIGFIMLFGATRPRAAD